MQIGGRRAARGLFDHAGDARDSCVPVLHPDYAVEVRLILGHRRDGNVVATALLIGLDHVGQAGLGRVVQHVRQ